MSNKRWIQRANRVLRRFYLAAVERFVLPQQFFALTKAERPRFALRWRDRWLCWGDATSQTSFDRHYVLHTAWACRVLAESKPALHVDISSSLYFVSNASAFVPMEFYDYRPAQLGLEGLRCSQGDLTKLHFPDVTESLALVSKYKLVLEHNTAVKSGEGRK